MLASSLFLKALGSSPSASPAWASLIPGFPSVVLSRCQPARMVLGPRLPSLPCAQCCFRLAPRSKCWMEPPVQDNWQDVCFVLALPSAGDPRKGAFPLSWSFQFFKACYDVREPFPGGVFLFPDLLFHLGHQRGPKISSVIHHLDFSLSLSLPLAPHPCSFDFIWP